MSKYHNLFSLVAILEHYHTIHHYNHSNLIQSAQLALLLNLQLYVSQLKTNLFEFRSINATILRVSLQTLTVVVTFIAFLII